MQYEYDRAVEQLKEGRVGLEQYRGLVERVTRQVSANRSHVQKLEAETKAYLKAGDRATAAKFALELQKAKAELAANEQQLQMHETAYGNNLKKIKHANDKLIELREKIQKYDAELKMSAAEAEIAKLAESFDMNLTTDFGQIEAVIQQKIDQNRGKVRVAADLSEKGIAEIQAEERMQAELAEQALTNFEVELGSEVAGDHAGGAGGEGPRPGDHGQAGTRSRRTRQRRRTTAFVCHRSEERAMANGQPKPAFYVAVLLVVVGLVGLAVWRYSAIGTGRSRRPVLERRAEADGRQRGDSRTARASRRSRNTTTSRAPSCPRSRASPATSRWPTAPCGSRSTSGPAGGRSSTPTTASSRARCGRRRAARTSRSSSC